MRTATARTRAERWRLILGLAAGLLVGPAAVVGAHWLTADDVLNELRAPATRQTFDVVDASRDEKLPRLLVVRVGPRWTAAPAAARQEAVEQWNRHWRDAVAQGIVAILDARTGQSLVRFDPNGRAALRDSR